MGVAGATLAGLIFPDGGRALLDMGAVDVGIVTMMLISGMKIPFERFKEVLRRPLPAVAALISIFCLAPPVALAAAHVLGFDAAADRLAVLILAAQATTLATAIVLTETAGGDTALAVVVSVSSNLLSALVTPAVFQLFCDAEVHVDQSAMIHSLLLKIAVPVAVGQLLRIPFKAFVTKHAKRLSFVSQALILIILYAGISSGHAQLEGGGVIVRVIGWALLLHGTMLLLNALMARVLIRTSETRTAFVLSASQKTLPAAILIWHNQFSHLPLGISAAVSHHIIQLVVDSLLAPAFRSLPLIRRKTARGRESL